MELAGVQVTVGFPQKRADSLKLCPVTTDNDHVIGSQSKEAVGMMKSETLRSVLWEVALVAVWLICAVLTIMAK